MCEGVTLWVGLIFVISIRKFFLAQGKEVKVLHVWGGNFMSGLDLCDQYRKVISCSRKRSEVSYMCEGVTLWVGLIFVISIGKFFLLKEKKWSVLHVWWGIFMGGLDLCDQYRKVLSSQRKEVKCPTCVRGYLYEWAWSLWSV